MKKAFLLFALLLGHAVPALAQFPRDPLLDHQITDYVRRIFQDSRGDMWFGTNGDGVIRYHGGSLQGFSVREGLGGEAVRGIVEDRDGNVWFGTNGGLSRWDGAGFTNFPVARVPANAAANDVWALTIDSRGTIWVGTLAGAFAFDGQAFEPGELPPVKPDVSRGVSSARLVHAIMEDSRGRLWFATSGGVFIRDGDRLQHLTTADGLCGDVVNDVLEAPDGSFWFATHHHGVCRLKDGVFTSFGAADGVEGEEAWDLFADRAGNVWFPTEHFGVYRFDGRSFRRFGTQDGLLSPAVQCTYQDPQGRIWVGGYLGLYRQDGERFINLTAELPWP